MRAAHFSRTTFGKTRSSNPIVSTEVEQVRQKSSLELLLELGWEQKLYAL